jgi:hypothetical protein
LCVHLNVEEHASTLGALQIHHSALKYELSTVVHLDKVWRLFSSLLKTICFAGHCRETAGGSINISQSHGQNVKRILYPVSRKKLPIACYKKQLQC